MENEKIKLLEGMDSYLPHVDGVITCMHNYCVYGSKRIDITAIAPSYRDYTDNQPYKIKRCKSIYFPGLNVQYGQATHDRKFYKEIMSEKYDIVHVNSPFNMAKFAVKIAKKQHIPAVATFHTNMRSIFRMVVKSKLIAEIGVKVLGRIYNKYDEIFVCSEPVAEQCRSYGYKGRISYLPFGTNIPKCQNKDELIKEANEKLNLSSDELVFIHVGRLEKLKRISFIMDALKILKDRGIKFRFYAIGTGGYEKKLKKHKKKLGFTDEEVTFTGFIDGETFKLLYARANLLLFPSLYDNFGLVKVEAAAYQTPGVFINGSCAGYGVKDGVDGYLSEDSPKAFADRVEEAVSDRQKLKEVGKKAGEDLYITWEECANQFVDRLYEVIQRCKKEGIKN